MRSADIVLKSSHLILAPSLVNNILEGSDTVYVAYQAQNQALLVSPKANSWFPKLHQAEEFLLKNKDLKGTRSVAIREILLDHEIDDADRHLTYTFHETNRFLKIDLNSPS